MGYEKFILDADQAGMMRRISARAWTLSENGQAMDALREVGPGAHFLGCAHTQANFETAFYRSSIADNNSFEQWEAEGSQGRRAARQRDLEAHAAGVRGAGHRRGRGRGAAGVRGAAQGGDARRQLLRDVGASAARKNSVTRPAPAGRTLAHGQARLT